MKRYCISIVLLLFSLSVTAQRAVNISGEYTYIAPNNISIEQAKAKAIEYAKLEALASEFGTIVSQTNMSTTKNINGESQTSFSSIGGTETKGEWIADTKKPEINIITENNTIVITAKVWGKAREIKKSDIDLFIQTLCNDMESESFKNNDRFAIRFKTPVQGYFSIFLIDDNVETAYCLLPYDSGKGNAVERNKEYEFLSTKDPTYPYKENTILTASQEVDFNRLVFIFSPNEFNMPLTEMGEYVMEIPTTKFDTWLRKNRINDPEMQVINKTIEIRK